MPVRIEGLKELRAVLKEVADASPREVTKALREGARAVTARSNQLAPRASGELAADGRPYATARAAGVRYTKRYAGVQEFATTWRRRNRSGDGTNTVHYTKNGAPPRFAHRAVDELGEGLVDSTFDRLTDILRLHGWFKG